MKTKEEIVNNWLPRYTGEKLENFGEYILLTNFGNYVNLFAQWHNVKVVGEDRPMQCATAGDITIINFGMGSPGAATIMDLLTAIKPKAALFLGKCGGLKKRNKLGDLILPIAAIRAREIPLLGVAFIGDENRDSEQTIAAMGRIRHLGRLPHLPHLDAGTLRTAFAAHVDLGNVLDISA